MSTEPSIPEIWTEKLLEQMREAPLFTELFPDYERPKLTRRQRMKYRIRRRWERIRVAIALKIAPELTPEDPYDF